MPAAIAVPAIISAGAAVGNAVLQNHAANKATKAETDAANQSLALEKAQFEETRGDLAPYRAAGASSLKNLGDIFGVSTAVPSAPALTNISMNAGGGGNTLANLGGSMPSTMSPAMAAQGGPAGMAPMALVPVQAPDGNVYHVPKMHLKDALANGGKVLQ